MLTYVQLIAFVVCLWSCECLHVCIQRERCLTQLGAYTLSVCKEGLLKSIECQKLSHVQTMAGRVIEATESCMPAGYYSGI